MCGFVSLFQPDRRFDQNLLAAMGEDIKHRGPDAGGFLSENGFASVFRRLAIIDPSSRSDQPMTDDAVSILFNGEIYNYLDLKENLIQCGASFSTSSDTEVILKGYKVWGPEVFHKLEGMFAIAIIDRNVGAAFIVRDPLGIKPLYLHKNGDLTVIASEVTPILRTCEPEPDVNALRELMTFGWASGTLSNYKNIKLIPRGHLLKLSLSSGDLVETTYCDALLTLKNKSNVNKDVIKETLDNSIRSHTISDVGYSLQLSGGVDSSYLASVCAQMSDAKLSSFSLTFEGKQFDESLYQQMVVDMYDLDHHRYNFSSRDYADELPHAIKHMEGPTPHGGCVGLKMLSKHISETSKVVLTGEGADEMFGGYERYQKWRHLVLKQMLGKLLPLSYMPDRWPFLGMKRLSGLDAAVYASVYFDFHSMWKMFPELIPLPGTREKISAEFSDFVSRMTAVDQSSYLESLLIRQDKMSMAHSVEVRVPFTHMPLLRVVNNVKNSAKLKGGITKPILKNIAAQKLPHDLVYRRKIGLIMPYNEWYSDPKGAGKYMDLLMDGQCKLRNYADERNLNQFVDSVVNKKPFDGGMARKLIETEMWLQTIKRPEGVQLNP